MNRREWKRRQYRKKSLIRRIAGVVFPILAILLCLGAGLFFLIKSEIFSLPQLSFHREKPAEEEPKLAPATFIIGESPLMSLEEIEARQAAREAEFNLSRWKTSHPPVRGIYITGPTAGSSRMEEILQLLDDTELNALVIDVKNDGGEITFQMEEGTPAEMGICKNYIKDIHGFMETLDSHGIYAIARIASFKDDELASARPELALMTAQGEYVTDGNGVKWVNPCSKEVWEYLTEIAEISADLGFDEIQYDYVRFPVGDVAEAADYGIELTEEEKHTYITGFLEYATERLHKKGIPVTADLFGTVIGNPWDVLKVGQDYPELGATVDALCPMIYPSHYGPGNFGIDVPDAHPYETILGALTQSRKELESVPAEQRAEVRAWLQAFSAPWVEGHISYGGEEIRAQIRAVYDAGYEQWILWNARNNYSADGLLDPTG
ncbi:MAG: putative glycoside hydrolase [Lachnospiraceae bacterium]|nr:putative glycoside hydrolase [Lachnospiraceae bacterium]